MLISIVTLNWNGLAVLGPCLDAIQENTHGDYEVIVLDNGSEESGVEEVVARHPKARLMKSALNLGFARGNNLAAREAQGDFLVFLNNDTLPQPGWIEGLLATLKADDACGLVGPLIADADGKVLYAGSYFVPAVREYLPAYRGYPCGAEELRQPRESEVYIACAIMLKRSLFQSVSGFDENYFQGYEDFDLCLKIREQGKTIRYCPESTVVHFENTSMRKLDSKTKRESRVRNAAYFSRKWGESFYKFRVHCPVELGDFSYYNNRRDQFCGFLPSKLGRVVEAGCGAGVMGERLKQENRAEYVLGIELSPRAGEMAKKRLDHVMIGDIEALSLDEFKGGFDSAICADVLEHLRDPWDALSKLRACLREGGTLFASIPNIGYYKVVKKIVRNEWRYDPDGILDRTHIRFFTLSTILEMFTLAGFQVEVVGREVKHTRWSRLLSRFYRRAEEFVTIQYYIQAKKLPDASTAVS